MMSSDTATQQLDGRTVREIVEHNHEMVSEAWCRRIVRQVLQSLEVQYGMRMPHRLITPDTLLILDSGDPMLLPSSDQEPDPESLPEIEARDMHDLAAVVHYAVTLDLVPTTPLRGRPLGDYSESFIEAIDRCLAPDPALRPHTIEQMRELLGIVVLAPPSAALLPPEEDDAAPVQAAAPADVPVAPVVTPAPPVAPAHLPRTRSAPDPVAAPAATERPRRWLLIGILALVLAAALVALFALLRQADSSDALALSVPPALEDPYSASETPLVALPQEPAARLEGPVIDESASGAPVAPPPAPDAAVPPTAVQLAPRGTPPEAAVAGTTYTLAVKPWGTIVVDGVERGASPPLRRITLPPGEHTIRIVNPGFPEHTVTVNSVEGQTGTIELDFTEEDAP
ncbi:PEGA domain-containing protein [Massilia sp. CFBP9012]|uniref:PEGA domain-containing protein n=1 Tax=Massilia sp. CFBP9012 TaxID=3096531 RepID=UPI002A6A765B|nr:PEGA domain-containing protein [Massilia sp. CFBP9012]MDY0976641.1 PEGA domain-containing protein [Massilia sp. CFBP9012]